jgi:hypothetical protein
MKKGFVIIAVLLSVLICGIAMAVDDTAIQELQTNVSTTKSKADKNAAEIQSMRGGLPTLEKRVVALEAALSDALITIDQLQAALVAEEAARIAAIESLQAQINEFDASALDGALEAIEALQSQIEGNTVLELNGYLSLDNSTALFTGVDVQIVNGEGTTDTTNGLGNLIVGYNSMLAGVIDGTRDGSHNIILGDGHEYPEHSELRTTNIVATPASLNIVSAGHIDLAAGLDISLNVGQDAIVQVGRDANLNVGMDANLNVGKDANLNAGFNANLNANALNLSTNDLNLDVAKDASMSVARDLALNVGGDTNLGLQDLILDARYVNFDLTHEFLLRASKINLRSSGDIIIKGNKIEEN